VFKNVQECSRGFRWVQVVAKGSSKRLQELEKGLKRVQRGSRAFKRKKGLKTI
jgi:hypothetical protein